MTSKDLKLRAGFETLACTLDCPSVQTTLPDAERAGVDVLSLHGGGPSNRQNSAYLTEALAFRGKSSLRFDFSGQGESSGTMAESSLKKRFEEARAVLATFEMSRGLTVIGTSMGSYIAAKLAASIKVENLILFCPAAYTPRAWDLLFGKGFTEVIRGPDSFLESDIAECLAGFNGKALLILAETDAVIPAGVIEMYESALRNCLRFEKFVIPACPHPIHRWLADRVTIRDEIAGRVADFVCP